MAIIRSPRPESHFSVIDNRVIRDGRLSFKARGILLMILSNVDNWRITADDLASKSKDGRAAVLSGLEELRDAGYIVTKRFQGEDGRWNTESYAYDVPQILPKFDFPTSVFPTSENRTLLEEPSKNNHKTAEPNGSQIARLVALYMDCFVGELRPSGGQVGNNIKRAVAAGMSLERIEALIPGIAMAGKELSPGTLRTQARIEAPKPQEVTPIPPRYEAEDRKDAVPMPSNFRELMQDALKNARGLD